MRQNRILLHLLLITLFLTSATTSFSHSFATSNNNNEVQTNAIDLTQASDSGLVKIMSYNIEAGGLNPNWKKVIQRENPDVLLLVETGTAYTPDKLQPLLNELNSYFPNENPYDGRTFDTHSETDGQGVISRFPIKDVNVADFMALDNGDIHDMNHPLIDVTVDFYGLDVHILVEHLSCCDSFNNRMLEQEAIMNYVDSLGDVPIIYGGDFNSGSPLDVGDVRPFQETLGVAPIEMMLNASAPHAPKNSIFTDSYRVLNPERKGYTLNSEGKYFSINHFRSRIDYIFVNQHLVNNIVNSSVVNSYDEAISSSDHMPMYTFFDFKLDDGLDQIPPISPTGLTTSAGDGKVTLNWKASSSTDVWKYSIYRNGCLIDEVSASTTQYVDDYMLNTDALYYYEIYPVDLSSNIGQPSLRAYAIPNQGELTVPSAPQLQVQSVAEGLNLTWNVEDNGGTPIDSYLIYKYIGSELVAKTGADPQFTVDRRVDGTSTGLVLTVPRTNIAIYIMMIAVNTVGESLKSDFVGAYSGGSTKTLPTSSQKEDSIDIDIHHYPENVDTICPQPKGLITELPSSNTSTEPTPSPVNILAFLFVLPMIEVIRKKRQSIV